MSTKKKFVVTIVACCIEFFEHFFAATKNVFVFIVLSRFCSQVAAHFYLINFATKVQRFFTLSNDTLLLLYC